MSENITNEIAAGDMNPVPENPKFPEGLRVLVVDDDPSYLKILSVMLQKCKYQVTQTASAAEALELLGENIESYDIVMTDVKMPDMDGFELVKIIGLEMDIPVIMMSADGDLNEVMKGVTYGARDYLVKPIRILELRNIWQHVVRKNLLHTEKSSEEIGTGNLPLKKRSGKSHKKDGASSSKKRRFAWTQEVHQKFIDAVNQLDANKVVPKHILEIMNEPQLTREIVASHLQKYRIYLKKQKEIMIEESSSNPMLREGNSSSANGVMTSGDHLSNSQTFSNSQFNEGVMIGHPNQQMNFWSPQTFQSTQMSNQTQSSKGKAVLEDAPSAQACVGNPPGRIMYDKYVDMSSQIPNYGVQSGPSGFPQHGPCTLPSAEHASYHGPPGVFGTVGTPYQTLEGPSVQIVQPFPRNALPGQQDGRVLTAFNGGVGTNYRGFPNSFQANDTDEVTACQGTHNMGQGTHMQQGTHVQRLTDNSYNYHHLSSEDDEVLYTEARQLGPSSAPML